MADPIAVIGFAFQFPQDVTTNGGFWDLLCEGRSTTTDVPRSRFNIDTFYHPDGSRARTFPVRGGHFIDRDLGSFDAPFFSIPPAEVACMDPQHLGMLETTYHALEDAGIPIAKCSGSNTSVYTGCFTNDFLSVMQQDYEIKQPYMAMGVSPAMLANRISWFFNLKGTSMNLDSACSSSLVALELACRDLQSGKSSMSLIGGANLIFHPNFMKMMSSFNFLSPDSQCWSFDERANGYARGEGLVMLVLKRLSTALQDGNTIRAIIRSAESNQDGRTPGITQPSIESQVRLIRHTYSVANLDMEPTRFFEAHGTGTAIGDVVEASSIGAAFRGHRTAQDPLYIGAVKASIGHLEGASGLAGVVKTILVLENGVIPPIAGLEQVNNRINADKLNLRVNSFGFGGTNATVVMDDAFHYLQLNGLHGYHRTRQLPPSSHALLGASPTLIRGYICNDTRLTEPTPTLLVWSARDKQAAQTLTTEYRGFIQGRACDTKSIAYTLAERRSHFEWRVFAVAYDSKASVIDDSVPPPNPKKVQDNPQLTYIFTGQGAQYLGMGRELFHYTAFRESVVLFDKCLQQFDCSWSVQHILRDDTNDISIEDPQYAQPLTTCLQIALVDLLASLGIVPAAVIGHSSGEIAAAYAIGGLSRFSAAVVAYFRGHFTSRLAREMSGFGMMTAGISRSAALPYLIRLRQLRDDIAVSVGCVNSPQNITLTGKEEQLDILEGWFESDSIVTRKLRVPVAYHSSAMRAIVQDYQLAMDKKVNSGPVRANSSITMISSVTSDVVQASALTCPEYWTNNLVSTVEFEGSLVRLMELCQRTTRQTPPGNRECQSNNLSISHFLELGPHSTLQRPVHETLRRFPDTRQPSYVPLLKRGQNSHVFLMEATGKLWRSGFPVDILAVNSTPRKPPLEVYPNMPAYPFTHAQPHWKEGRLSENFRLKSTPRRDLIGTRSLDWNPQLAQWRNTLRTSEVLWLRDHTIDGVILVPAAAMVVMAIEGLMDVLGDEASLTGIELRDVEFLHPIRFAQNRDEVETQLTLAAVSRPEVFICFHFMLFVFEGGSYTECCRGNIRGCFDGDIRPSHMPDGPSLSAWASSVRGACVRSVDVYSNPPSGGIQYGPYFQNLHSVRVGPKGQGAGEVDIDGWKEYTHGQDEGPNYIIHPCTLDALAQLVLPALSGEEDMGTLPAMVPAKASRIWIDTSAARPQQSGWLAAVASGKCVNRGTASTIIALTQETAVPILGIEGLQSRFIDSMPATSSSTSSNAGHLCTRLLWKPDITTMDNKQVREEITRGRPNEPVTAISRYRNLQSAILYFIHTTLEYLDMHSPVHIPDHLQEFFIPWMKDQQKALQQDASTAAVQELLANKATAEDFIAETEGSGVEGHFFMQIGRNLLPILRGEIDPLDLMFRDGLADRYYEEMLSSPFYAHPVMVYLQHMCFKNPWLNVLEVGAGTGGQTLRLLEALFAHGIPGCKRYDYTDISPAFFGRARDRFRKYKGVMHFRTLDISRAPVLQSFRPAEYDLVIASHVLHATPNIDQALRNIHTLLKPGGKLLLFEITRPSALHIGFAFGLLKGWWEPLKHEARSTLSPCLETSVWDQALGRGGFSGTDVEVPGQEHLDCQYSSIFLSTALGDGASSSSDVAHCRLLLVTDPGNHHQAQVAEAIRELATVPTSQVSLEEPALLDVNPSTCVVFLLEVHAVILDGISADIYEYLQSVLTKAKDTLWVGQSISPEDHPQQHLAEGLGRTLASEDSTRKFVTLILDHRETQEEAARLITKTVKHIRSSALETLEANLVSKGGILQIPRISANTKINDRTSRLAKHTCQTSRQISTDTVFRIDREHLSRSGSLRYIEDAQLDEFSTELQPDEVIVHVKAFGLCLRDYLVYSGQTDQLDLGTEFSGIITMTGSASGHAVGDPVCVIGMNLARSRVRVRGANAVRIPASMSFAEAASVPTALWTAHYALFNLARLQPGETVLVLEACTSEGQLLVQVSLKCGARVLAAVDGYNRKDFICGALGLCDEDVVVLTRHDTLVANIHQLTKVKKIDVLVGPLSHLDGIDLSGSLAPCGRVIDMDIGRNWRGGSSTRSLLDNVSYARLNISDVFEANPTLAGQTFQDAMHLYSKQDLHPPQPLKTFPADKVDAAFRDFQDTDILKKRIVELADGMTIPVECLTKPSRILSGDASYVIAGGLGGLGRLFARWMASRGARHLILLSRSGASTSAARELVKELELQGVKVATPHVDIGDLPRLVDVMSDLAISMPPIRGCIQATMVLRDNLFENMTHKDWTVSTRSKVTGSWNLHITLPTSTTLDFFILISSTNGVFGNRGQANYAAGNTFQDALARYRIERGQRAVSIDLGLMVSAGAVATNKTLLASLRRLGHLMELQTGDLLALLEHICNADPDLASPGLDDAQVIVGLELPSTVSSRGLDLHHSIKRPLFNHLFQMTASPRSSSTGIATDPDSDPAGTNNALRTKAISISKAAALNAAHTDEEATNLVLNWARAKISHSLGMPVADIDPDKPIHKIGIDSLVGVDLRNWFASELGAPVTVFDLMGSESLRDIVGGVVAGTRFRSDC
ncbi:type I polyketide synthase [Aspergillus stella-maris]|uniref:type I polyketide synthase n=1 Tax=Aspergillus stella-maris TaxID=1810926 RepID=UPI003CCDD6FD